VRVLLDSHAFLWMAQDDDRLPAAVRDLLLDGRTRAILSVASTWELTLKVLKGSLRLPMSPADYFEARRDALDLDLLPVHQRHVDALPELPAIHGDPFDRMLVAQALVEDLEIVTGDRAITAYPVRTIW
jgi:PIN domain nuclease of toxin-antitoxin system